MGRRQGTVVVKCEACRRRLRQRANETAKVFAKRRFCSRACIYAPRRALTPAEVHVARLYILAGMQGRAIARMLDISENVIYGLTANKTYLHLPWPDYPSS